MAARSSLCESRKLWEPARKLLVVDERKLSLSREVSDTSSTCSSSGSFAGYKTVRFAAEPPKTVKIRSFRYMSPQEKKATWYDKEEREAIRSTARFDAFKAISLYPKHVKDMKQLQKNARYLATTLDSTETDRFLRERGARTKALKHIRGSDACTLQFRGLEDWVSPQEHHERIESADESRAMVVQMMRHSSVQTAAFSEDLASDYEHMTRFAVIYARLRGELDALAASDDLGAIQMDQRRRKGTDAVAWDRVEL